MRTPFLPLALAAILSLPLTLGACSNMSDTQRRTATGAGVGAAAGALIGAGSANAGKGALIGAAVGAAGGYLYDQSQKSSEQK
jgi:uncharacterized membrane protein